MTEEAEEAFQELKRYLTSPPVMVAPEPGGPLLLYITMIAEAMSMVLIAELSCTLWGNRTSPSQATGETPFFLVYGAEVVLPPEVTMGSLRVQTYDETMQDQLRHDDIDLIDERRWQSAIKNVRYRQALQHYH
jgi:hypothetical protein